MGLVTLFGVLGSLMFGLHSICLWYCFDWFLWSFRVFTSVFGLHDWFPVYLRFVVWFIVTDSCLCGLFRFVYLLDYVLNFELVCCYVWIWLLWFYWLILLCMTDFVFLLLVVWICLCCACFVFCLTPVVLWFVLRRFRSGFKFWLTDLCSFAFLVWFAVRLSFTCWICLLGYLVFWLLDLGCWWLLFAVWAFSALFVFWLFAYFGF